MAIDIKHAFVSAKLDGPDTTQVQPSDWNDSHTIEMATASLLGRVSGGTGAVEELTLGNGLMFSGSTLALATNPAVAGNLTVAGTTQLTGALSLGGAANASAVLDFSSTTKGALLPRMTTAQRDAIGSPATGLVVYNTTTEQLEVKRTAAWGAVVVAQAASANLTELAAPTYVRGDLIRRGAAALERLTPTGVGQSVVFDGTDSVWGRDEYFYRINADIVGANDTSAQNTLGVGVTVEASSVYEFEVHARLEKSAGASNHSTFFSFGGTATFNNASRLAVRRIISQSDITSMGYSGDMAAGVGYTSIISASVEFTFFETGTFSVNAGGTVIPQYQLSVAPGGAYTVKAGAYMRLRKLGPAGVLSVGPWA